MVVGVHINMKEKINKNKKELEENNEMDVVEERGIKNFLIRILKGIAIGIGAILPGVSGGALAVIFGIYEPAIKFLSNLRHKFWKNVSFFIPSVIGLLIVYSCVYYIIYWFCYRNNSLII